MELLITQVIKSLVLPPGLFLLLLLAGLLTLNKKPVLGKSLLFSCLISIYLLSTPFIAQLLINQVETYPAQEVSNMADLEADAIVILAGDWQNDAKEYGRGTVGQHTLTRSRYGAFLQRETGLPILVSGGVLNDQMSSLAQMMAELLRDEFNAGEVWLEDKSRTTGENALFSKKILQQKDIDNVILVTDAMHMPRSVAIFQKNGLKIIAAPTHFKGDELAFDSLRLSSVLPSGWALNLSRSALHELVGAVWYRYRY